MRDWHVSELSGSDERVGPAGAGGRRPEEVVLVLGGTRSGKSAYAERLAAAREKAAGGPVLYVATAGGHPDDAAMRERIRAHRARRSPSWETFECPIHLGSALETLLSARTAGRAGKEDGLPAVVLVDCVTLWLSNLLFAVSGEQPEGGGDGSLPFERAVEEEVAALLGVMRRFPCLWVIVSGETGLGLVAPTPVGRRYCDGLGLANQLLAEAADRVWFMVAGRALALPPSIG